MVAMTRSGVNLESMDDAWRFCEAIARTEMVPKGMRGKPAEVFGVIQAGFELGLTPFRSLANMKIINGRVGPMGKLGKALVRREKALKPGTGFIEIFSGDPETDEFTATVTTHRAGEDRPVSTSFSVKDAKLAGLWGKVGKFGPSPWVTYPKRMLMWRAIGFHLDDYYGDVLMGMPIAEVLADMPEALLTDRTPVVMEQKKEVMKDPLLELAAISAELQPPQDPIDPDDPADSEITVDGAPTESAAELAEDMADLVPDGVNPKTGEYIDTGGSVLNTEFNDLIGPDGKQITKIGRQAPASLSPLSAEMTELEALEALKEEGENISDEALAAADPDNVSLEGAEQEDLLKGID